MVGFVESGGARMQEGMAALGGYARIFRETVALSGRVPQVSVVTGLSAGRRGLLARAHRLLGVGPATSLRRAPRSKNG